MIPLSSEYTTALKLGDVNHIPSQAFAHYQTGQNSQKPVCFTEPAQLSCQSPVWRYADICTRPQVHVASSLRSSLVCWLCLRKELVRDTGERSLAGTLLFIIAFRSRNIFSKLELLVTKKFWPFADLSSGGRKVYLIFTQINKEPCQWPQFPPMCKIWFYLPTSHHNNFFKKSHDNGNRSELRIWSLFSPLNTFPCHFCSSPHPLWGS